MANVFKLACEVAIMFTLILAVLLKIDLSSEDVSESFIGVMLIFANVVLPVIALVSGILICASNPLLGNQRPSCGSCSSVPIWTLSDTDAIFLYRWRCGPRQGPRSGASKIRKDFQPDAAVLRKRSEPLEIGGYY